MLVFPQYRGPICVVFFPPFSATRNGQVYTRDNLSSVEDLGELFQFC